MNLFPNVHSAIQATRHYLLRNGEVSISESWQGVKDSKPFFEALNWNFSCPIPFTKDEMVKQIKPNTEWADLQFEERVGGYPLNPGESYKVWPMYKNNAQNDKFRTEDQKFSHTYMERFWPKRAVESLGTDFTLKGIRYAYGDFNDVINLLVKQPNTRQAFLPIWFPEDTGVLHGGRVPCTIGYWFVRRQGSLHITYTIRACDYFRHFRDDIYLAMRLVHYIIDQIKWADGWKDITPGILTMNIGSLHIFGNEVKLLQNEQIG
jgi:thymidylate synthase